MAKLKIIDTRWLPFFSYFANKWDKTCGGNAHRCTLPVCTCNRFEHTHVPPVSKCATPASHTHRANCLVFIRRLPPPALCEQGTINQGHFLRRVDVLSHRMWLKRIMGTRDSVGRGRNPHPPPTKPFMSGNLYMPTKYWTVCKCVMYTQAPECNKEISGR